MKPIVGRNRRTGKNAGGQAERATSRATDERSVKKADESSARETRAEIAADLARRLKKLDSPRIRQRDDGAVEPVGNMADWFEGIVASTGSTNVHLQDALMRGAALAMGCAEDEGNKAKPFVERANMGLAIMHAINPRTPLEGLLATQMAAAHAMAMRAVDYACWSRDHDVKTNWARLATKFMSTFAQQIEALERLRGRGGSTQTVRVEHVTVEAGGQAIVGAVCRGRGEEWNEKPRNDPMHAGAAPRPEESAAADLADSTPSADGHAAGCMAASLPARRRGTRTP